MSELLAGVAWVLLQNSKEQHKFTLSKDVAPYALSKCISKTWSKITGRPYLGFSNWREPNLAEHITLQICERENEKTVVVPYAGPAWLITKSENMCSESISLTEWEGEYFQEALGN